MNTLLLFLNLQSLDVLTTHFALKSGAVEANAIAAEILNNHGEIWMYLLKAFLVLLVALTVVRVSKFYPRLWRGIWISNCFYCLVIAINVSSLLAG